MKPGFYNMSLWDYLNGPGVNRSLLVDLAELPPGEAKYNQDHDDITDATRLGDATHAAILEPDRFKKEYVVLPDDCRPGSGAGMKARKEKFEAEAERDGKRIIRKDDLQNILEMQAVINSDQNALNLLRDGDAELSGFYIEPDNGILCKFRADWVRKPTNTNVDLKTAADVRPFLWRAHAYSYGYDIQAYMTLRGMTILTGIEHVDFRFLCVKSKGYHGLKIYKADKDMLLSGEERYFRALDVYAECVSSGEWPGYDSTVEEIGVPKFRREQLDEIYG